MAGDSATRMTAAEATVRMLALNGIDTLFALPGVQNDHLFNALHDAQDKIRTLNVRHEQGAAYMALGAAMATGKPSAYAVVPGPGVLNTTAALSTAYACSAPVLCITGQIPQPMIGRGYGMLHEIPDQLGHLARLTKWAARIRSPEEAPSIVAEAFRQLRSGRPRPVAIECPLDVWPRMGAVSLPARPAEPDLIAIDSDAIEAAASLLGKAEKPLIFIGGGALDAGPELAELAEMLQAPVVTHRMGLGALDARHPFSVNAYLGFKLWAECDVVLGVGSRMQVPLMQWGTDKSLKVVRIDADPEEIDRIERPAVRVLADAVPALRALIAALPKHNHRRVPRKEEMVERKAATAKELAERFAPQAGFLDAIRAELPEDGIFVDELTQIGYVSRLLMPFYKPRTFLTNAYQGTLGWGVATAIGAKAVRPDVPVVAISGDGGFMFNVQELASAAQHRVPVVFVLMNDGAYGNVRREQIQTFGNRLIASDLKNPDFLKLADAFGIMGLRATNPAELRVQLKKAMASGEPAIIEVPVGAEMPSPWSFLRFQQRARPIA